MVRELEADAEMARLVPLWWCVRSEMHRRANASGGTLTPLAVFAEYVEENLPEIERQLAEASA